MRTYRDTQIARLRYASGVLLALAGGAMLWPASARAQVAGTSSKPLPNVLLLVDTSGSMERMPDGSLPGATAGSACAPGSASDPNRWGMLLQALTGNLQPYYSCEAVARDASNAAFVNEYSILGKAPYDVDYALPYHRPMTGGTAANACVMAPHILPGSAGGAASDFPDDALATVYRSYLNTVGFNLPSSLPATASCTFDQAIDGQLDAARDYVRFALMTFDNDAHHGTGLQTGTSFIDTNNPFLGQWSYHRSEGNPLYSSQSNDATRGARGLLPGCVDYDYLEVGARNEFAPPWEGRLVPFPPPEAPLYEIQRTNEQIQKVLLATRPFGATPLDGMFDDARDYYWYRKPGPAGDPYACRDKYIIALTDGAPNLDLRPACGPTGEGDICPYPHTAAEIAHRMHTDSDEARRVTTFVIGFSVNGSGTFDGDGFPPGFTEHPKNNCKTWYHEEGQNNPATMAARCEALAGSIPPGSTADACCKLNEIAWKGSGGTAGPFFAESQADIVLSFGRIMANIIKAASTRTLPAYTPAVEFSADSFTGGAAAGQFIASFIPNAQRPWSGEIDRTRFQCTADGAGAPSEATQETTAGDFMSANLAVQAKEKKRFFLSVLAEKDGGSIDSLATIRPFSGKGSTGADGIPSKSGREVAMANDNVFDTDWPVALDIDDTTCKRSKAVKPGEGAGARGTVTVPALDRDECTSVVWGFTTAHPDPLSYAGTQLPGDTGPYDFNVRCGGSGSPTTGTCSVSGNPCTVGEDDCAGGEICVPECAALGAVFRSNPAVIGAPSGFLREEGFRTFQATRRTRRPVLFVATIDGMLHAFKAMDEGGTGSNHELWSFVPPAVLPKLATNYPAGNQVLLDGSPVVRETVWERLPTDNAGDGSGRKWHTTLVASLGAGGGGFYALNVTDADCGGSSSVGDCLSTENYQAPTEGELEHVSTSGIIDERTKKGPHFLWQLTDVEKAAGGAEAAKVVRRTRTGEERVALFGRDTGTPAIGMVQIKTEDGERQVGVAILPGGIDGPPVPGETCQRSPGDHPMHDKTAGDVRTHVRRWASSCDAPVPGRGVTIVRLDTGDVIRHFGRLGDTPTRLHTRVIETGFDSPMVGVPVVYPDSIGVPTQKVFIGDADGTLWRIDLTSSNPDNWSASLFQDLYAGDGATDGQPIEVPPVLSTDEAGQLVINVATGDQESLIHTNAKNLVASLRETRDALTHLPVSSVNWSLHLTETEKCDGCGARVTGPMVVFDRTLYFATYAPLPPKDATAKTCGEAGSARIWGLHYTEPKDDKDFRSGGLARYCNDGDVGATGLCNTELAYNEWMDTDLIPGVTLRASAPCATFDTLGDELGGQGFASIIPQEYHLTFGVARPAGGSGLPAAHRRTDFKRPMPQTSTKIDSWSLVIE